MALVYTAPGHIELRDVPDPVAAGEVPIEARHVGICGSDMRAFAGHGERRPAPLILGHEGAGVIIDGPRAGTPVVVDLLVTGGDCAHCRAGPSSMSVSAPEPAGSTSVA